MMVGMCGAPIRHSSPPDSPAELATFIDHTLLRPEAMPDDIDRLSAEAQRWQFAGVVVNPCHVARAADRLAGCGVTVGTVAGFPLGASTTACKTAETERALADGAREIDMVINIGALKAGDHAAVRDDIAAVAGACRQGRGLCKVIIETCLLNDEEKERACALAADAGADFVKTSTGFAASGATVADVRLMRRAVARTGLGVKAAGGIRTLDDALTMIAAGADRLGTSAGVAIMKQAAEAWP